MKNLNKYNITINVTLVVCIVLFSLSIVGWMTKFNFEITLLLLYAAFTESKRFNPQKMQCSSIPILLLQNTGQSSSIRSIPNILFISLYH